MSKEITCSLVVPVYNEEKNIAAFTERAVEALKKTGLFYEIIFINDGSNDQSWSVLEKIAEKTPAIKLIDFSRNFGKESALTAGLQFARGDIVIPMDADLQHPPEFIQTLIETWQKGYEIVMARRLNRPQEGIILKEFKKYFYRIMSFSSVQLHQNVGDFCLITRPVVDAILQLNERQRFMKGIFAWVGFKQAIVDYVCEERLHGRSKWSFMKLFSFAIDGITSFSILPLRFLLYMGTLIFIAAAFYAAIIIFQVIFHGHDVPGYASLMVGISLLGGLQMIGLGMVGEYVGRTYLETKQRPVYIVRSITGFDQKNKSKDAHAG